jgi:hypothetical protein
MVGEITITARAAERLKGLFTRDQVHEERVSYWQLILLQSKASGCFYHGKNLPHNIWAWPKQTWFQERLSHYLKPQWSPQNRPTDRARDLGFFVLLPLCFLILQVHFSAPAAGAAFEDMTVMEEAVKHGGNGSTVAEELSPVLHRTVGSQKGAGPLITAHDDLEEILGSAGW